MNAPRGYFTLLAGDLGDDLADAPTKRRYRLPEYPPVRWSEPDTDLLGRILTRLDEL